MIPAVVFAIALAIRLAHVLAIRDAPFFALLMGDSRGYDVWAQQIAAGSVSARLFPAARTPPQAEGLS